MFYPSSSVVYCPGRFSHTCRRWPCSGVAFLLRPPSNKKSLLHIYMIRFLFLIYLFVINISHFFDWIIENNHGTITPFETICFVSHTIPQHLSLQHLFNFCNFLSVCFCFSVDDFTGSSRLSQNR